MWMKYKNAQANLLLGRFLMYKGVNYLLGS